MFKKKPQIKNLSPLRSSDRRKLADQIIAQYEVHVPPAPLALDDIENESSRDEHALNPLTSIRLSLLPENCSSARFTTRAGPDAKLLSGTVYVGSPPGAEHRILWFQLGPSDHRLYPTVYSLWRNPGLVPLLHTPGFVVEKLQTGADLMTPGLARGPPFPTKAKKGITVAVAGVERPTVPICLGVCEIDVSALGQVQGIKGHAVKGVHWEGDELWAWSTNGVGGRGPPETIDGWDASIKIPDLNEGMESMAVDKDDVDGQDGGGGVLLDSTHHDMTPDGNSQVQPERELSVHEIDEAFHNAFLYAVHSARKKGSPPHYGIDLPLGPSTLISNLIQPFLPAHANPETQYTIKKTSWKGTKKFIKHLDKRALVKSKDRNGGETVIVDIDFDDQQVLNFTPYRLSKPDDRDNAGSHNRTASKHGNSLPSDSPHHQKLDVQILIRPSPKLVPDLIPAQPDYYTPHQVSNLIRTYIDQHPDLTSQSSSPRFVKLDPFLANNVLGSKPSSSAQAIDAKALAAGEIARDILPKRILEDNRLCQPYWVLLQGNQTWSPESAALLPKPKAGSPPKLSIVIEKRTGTKTVTKVGNLEVFGINPDLLAGTLQKKCASSTSVGQRVGGKPGQMEVLIQGDQRDVVQREVGKMGVAERWIEVTDKAKKQGKK